VNSNFEPINCAYVDDFTGIDPLSRYLSFKVHPNPTSGKVKIVISENFIIGSYLLLYDFGGRSVRKHLIQYRVDWINLTGNTPGVYLIKSDFKEITPVRIVLK
jgi:hypothetical protein